MQTQYLQTDFDLVGRRSLVSLRSSLVSLGLHEVNEYRRGRLWCAGFESPRSHRTPDSCVRAILKVLDGLDGKTRKLLQACTSRTVDIAYEVAADCDRFTDGLSPRTIVRLAAYEVGVRFTFYASDLAPPA